MSKELWSAEKQKEIEEIEGSWQTERWEGIRRTYTAEDVYDKRCSVKAAMDYPYARYASGKYWGLLNGEPVVFALGALTGMQAVNYVSGGIPVIYVSGWQVAADANIDGETYPDQSLYSAASVPALVRRINKALRKQSRIYRSEGRDKDWFAPIVADAEAGFGGNLNAEVLMEWMIEAGAAAVHYEDQISTEKKCGHMGGKVLDTTQNFINKLVAARLAADTLDVPTVLIARTDANVKKKVTGAGGTMLLSASGDMDERDKPFMTKERAEKGYFWVRGGLDMAISRGLSYAPYADVLWCETSTPDLKEARIFSEAIFRKFPDKLLAYNLSPSFNWKSHLDDQTISKFNRELGAMGYKFQFVTLSGYHLSNLGAFKLARKFVESGMSAYVELQQEEFAEREHGYEGVEHQRLAGAGFHDKMAQTISIIQDKSTLAMEGSTAEQFKTEK